MRALMTAGLVLLICACERSKAYFDGHADARAVALKQCASGVLRGRECDQAAASEATARHSDAEQTFKTMSEGR